MDAAQFKNSKINGGFAGFYTVEGRNMNLYTHVFWIGEPPSLSEKEKNNRAFREKYSGRTVVGVVKNLTFSNTTHQPDGFILESNSQLFKIPTNNPNEAQRLMTMIGIGDIVIIEVSWASLINDNAILVPATLIKDGERLIAKGSVQI